MQRVNTSVRIVPELLEKLGQIARADGRRTRNQLIEDAIDKFVSKRWRPEMARGKSVTKPR
jgi:predicted transcriptional regulator